MHLPPDSPLVRALRLLALGAEEPSQAEELSALEAAWLSGYFAALARDPARREASGMTGALLSNGPREVKSSARVRVLYGSETGNSAALATRVADCLRALNLTVDVLDLADYRARQLESERTVLFVTSTHGDGAPPERATQFFESLTGPTAPKSLKNLRFSVLGLGDTSYEHFCRAAKVLDERLAELGAERVLARVDCDVEYEARATDCI
jgi:sulfite reductase (NADPH) flavoprotein alpha-component